MAAVATNHMSEGLRGIDHDQYAEPNTTRFTAVNGQGSPAATNGHESETIVVEDLNSRPNSQAVRRQPSPPRSTGDHSRTPSRQMVESSSQSPIKRKRSYPDEDDDRSNQPYHSQAFHSERRDQQPLSPSLEGRGTNGRTNHDDPIRHQPEPLARPSHGPLDYEQERPPPLSSDYDPHAHPNQPYFSQPPDSADARMVEALQKGSQTSHPPQMRTDFVSPEGDDGHDPQNYGSYTATNCGSMSGDGNRDHKRRKRVFSNRTKTGCLTCRRRKKKCDEAHPECNNCLRGGFVCEGYTSRNTWQKPAPSKTPIPLQSKTEYDAARAQKSRYNNEISPEIAGESPAPPRHRQSSDGERSKPILVEEDHKNPYMMTSPPDTVRTKPWIKTSRPHSSHPSTASKYESDFDYRPVSGAHEGHETPEPIPARQSRNPHRTHAGPFPPHLSTSRSSHTHSSHTAPAVAQAALQHSSTSRRSSPHHHVERIEFTEREKMLRGEHYLPYTPTLVEDREKCLAAVSRFNNSTSPNTGIRPEERMRFFKAIINLRPSPESRRTTSDGHNPMDPVYLPFGSVGPGVIVEAPFHCDYGYNITIGRDVVIGPDCRITDTCAVNIGDNVVFGPNVKLVCTNYAIDPRERKKGKGRALGRSIIIEHDCWIGSNVTITPGITVGKCSVVGASSLVCDNIPPYTVVGGNPSKIIRGIYDECVD